MKDFYKKPSFYCLAAYLLFVILGEAIDSYHNEASLSDGLILGILAALFALDGFIEYKRDADIKPSLTEEDRELQELDRKLHKKQREVALQQVQNQEFMQSMKMQNLGKEGRTNEQRLKF